MTDMVPGDPRERRADVVAIIAAKEQGEALVSEFRWKLFRYLELEVLSTEKDDHTKSLSERVTTLEKELGGIREEQRQFLANLRWKEEHGTWWQHVKFLFSRRRWRR